MYNKFEQQKPFALLDTSKYPPEVAGRFNSFITTQFDDSLSVEMQMRSIIKWAINNFKDMDQTYNDFTEYVIQGNLNPFIQFLNDLIEYMNNFIETFDEKYQETILDKMQEWYVNGELETLINESLDTKYHEMDNRLTTQLAQTKSDLQSGLNSKVTHGENESVTWAMASQGFKEQITGGNTAVVGEESVNTSNIIDKAVSSQKRTPLGERGFVTGTLPATVDLVNNNIHYSVETTHHVYYRGERYAIPNGTVIDLDVAEQNICGIFFSVETNIFHVIGSSRLSNVEESMILLGWIYKQNLRGSDLFGNYEYIGDRTKNYDLGHVLSSEPVDFDFEQKKMVISPDTNTTLYNKGTSFRLPRLNGQNVYSFADIAEDERIVRAVYNTKNDDVYFVGEVESYSSNDILVAVIRHDVPAGHQVLMNGRYTINGKSEIDKELESRQVPTAETVIQYTLEDSINSWWVYPLAKRYKGIRDKTYLGYTDRAGWSGVASIDHNTGQVIKSRLMNVGADDHNALAVEVMQDGKIITAYSEGHNDSTNLHIHISEKTESVERWGNHTTIDVGELTSYAQLFFKNDKWWLFFRSGNTNWSYISSDDGINWTEPTKWYVGVNQAYVKVMDTTDHNLLRVVVTYNPNVSNTNLGLGFFNTSTLEFTDSDGNVLGTNDIPRSDFPDIVVRDSGKSQRLLDVAITSTSKTSILFADFTDETDIKYKVAYNESGDTNIVELTDGGKPFYIPSRYVGGMVWGNNDKTIYLSREESGDWFIEKWETTDYSSFTKAEEIHQSANGNVAIRPVFEKDGSLVVWQKGHYNSTNYRDFLTDYRYVDTE